MKKALIIWKLLILVGMLILPGVVRADIDFGDDVEDVHVPFDGGVSLLVAAAIGYGLKKVRNKRKKV